MYSTKNIAIVILNWNGKALLAQFLPSVVAHSKTAKIYVADNASTDNSVAYVKTHFPQVTIIKNKENYGYAKGYNQALKQVNEPILCLLNSDVEVTKNWLQPIVELFNNEENTAIIQPKILDYKRKIHFEYAGAAGGFIDALGYPYCRGRIFDSIEEDKGQYNDIVDIFWASGACFFIKNEVFKQLHGFDEGFFAHMEEIDLCWRAFNQNYTTKYVSTSTVYHVGGATLSNLSAKKTYLNFRNSLYTLTKNAFGKLYLKIFIRLVLDGIAALKFMLQLKPKHSLAILNAHLSFYGNLKPILKKRNKLPKQKKRYYQTISIVWNYYILKKKRF